MSRIGVDRFGVIDLEELRATIDAETTLCSVMLANNEVGTVEPMQEIVTLAHAANVPVHTDAVQAAGALRLNVREMAVDAMSLAGHKVGAPKGTGMLYLRGRLPIEPVLHGGGQERGRRSGTENVAGAVGFATALELAARMQPERAQQLQQLRDELIHGVLAQVPEAMLTGHPVQRLPNSASFCFPGTSGESVLLQLEQRGIVCSSGSACAAGSDAPSHVLLAMGVAPASRRRRYGSRSVRARPRSRSQRRSGRCGRRARRCTRLLPRWLSEARGTLDVAELVQEAGAAVFAPFQRQNLRRGGASYEVSALWQFELSG